MLKIIAIGTSCPYCDQKITAKNVSLDHVTPRSWNVIKKHNTCNIIACCKDCNNKKSNIGMLQFMGLL